MGKKPVDVEEDKSSSSERSVMAIIGKYIYGIINSNANLYLSIPKEIFSEESKPNGIVYTIPHQDISALVRDSEAVDYTHMRRDILARFLVGHQMVVERMMTPQATIIPVRLGTFVQDEIEVNDILNKGYNLIKRIFEKISDKVEIDVTATWNDFSLMVKEVGEEKEIKEFKERFLNNPKGITADDRMRIGFMLKKALDERRQEFARRIQERLGDLSEDTRIHELMDDNMVINSAFLIHKALRKDFEKRIEEINSEFNEKLNFRCVGPLPSYSFYTLEIKKIQSQDLVWARDRLNLNDVLDREGVKKAYQRNAFSSHPDKNPDKPGIEKEFDEVTKAYRILVEYCQALEQAGQDKILLNEQEGQRDMLLVKVKD